MSSWKLFSTPVISWGVSGPEDQFYFQLDDSSGVDGILTEAERVKDQFLDRVRADVAKLPEVKKAAKKPDDRAVYDSARTAVKDLVRSRLLADGQRRETEMSEGVARIVEKIADELTKLSTLLMSGVKLSDVERSLDFFVSEIMLSVAGEAVKA